MLNWLLYSIIFIFGLVVGSFLNCVIYRLEKGESFLKGRSFCDSCQHKLSWRDLIPILSFLILRGKCRYCQQKISLQYPLVEFFTGILFILILRILGLGLDLTFGFWTLNLFYYLIITCFLIVIFVYDLKYYIIPDKIIYSAIAIVFLYQLLGIWPPTNFWWGVGFGILPSLFFLTIILFSRGKWMGFGDFKLAVFMGLFLAWPKILIALFLAIISGAIIGVGLVISGKKHLSSEIPFGPFLVSGTFLALFLGQQIINWYLNLTGI